jgi:L-lysine 2,3-aminomutase
MCNSKNYLRKLDRQAVRKKYDEYMKDKKCVHCGNDDISVLEWHHLDPSQKDANVPNLAGRYKWERVLAEIMKCICLCRNCHKKEHDRNKGNYKYKVKKIFLPLPFLDS